MAHLLTRDFTPAEHRSCCLRNDFRTDYAWQSDDSGLVLLKDGEGYTVCAGGFYSPWLGTREEFVNMVAKWDQED